MRYSVRRQVPHLACMLVMMVSWDSTEVAFCCLPQVTHLLVSQPKPFLLVLHVTRGEFGYSYIRGRGGSLTSVE